MDTIQSYIRSKLTTNASCKDLSPGDTVNVFVKVREGEKERVQAYMGVVIKLQGSGPNRAFTVRKISDGVGVERTFPMASPLIERVEILSKGKVRRSKLYFLRALSGKAARLESKLVTPATVSAAAKEAVAPTEKN